MLYFETGKQILSKIILVPQVSEATEDLISVLYQLLEISPKNSDESFSAAGFCSYESQILVKMCPTDGLL